MKPLDPPFIFFAQQIINNDYETLETLGKRIYIPEIRFNKLMKNELEPADFEFDNLLIVYCKTKEINNEKNRLY